ncbi:hypothetical protein QQY79_04635 [Flavobacterium tructae]|uniref:hypothetical protein n=1 Tax=Flavobacterium tructae TaxID=1114873 RepID=UPI002551D45B|nr:hypothetical protein [Flavobacterium tructae]MDL2141794.1 hypothetical protein [Flavobacterium tructae]
MKRTLALGILIIVFGCKKLEPSISKTENVAIKENKKISGTEDAQSNVGSEIITFKKVECVDDCYYLFTDAKGNDVIIYLPDYCKYNFDDGDYVGEKFEITYNLPKVSNEELLAQSIELIESKESKISSKNSSQKSFGEIRSLIISGNEKNMIRQLGKPDEQYSAHDFLEKYYNWKPISVYTSQRPIGIDVFVYHGIDNTNSTILVIYNFEKSRVTDLLYKSDVNSFEDICVH